MVGVRAAGVILAVPLTGLQMSSVENALSLPRLKLPFRLCPPSPSRTSHHSVSDPVHAVIRRSTFLTEVDEDEQEQVYDLDPPEQLQGGTNHLIFMIELLSHIKEFLALIPDSGEDPPWCGDGDRFFVDNQVSIARSLANAHEAWDDVSSGFPRRTWKGSLAGMAFAIEGMEDGELIGEVMSKADYQLLFRALNCMTARKVLETTDRSEVNILTVDLNVRDYLTMFVPEFS